MRSRNLIRNRGAVKKRDTNRQVDVQWPAPEDPDGSPDEQLAGRELIAQRLGDEVACCGTAQPGWLNLSSTSTPPVINVPSEADHPERRNIVVDVGRLRRVRLWIAADMDELARARIIEELEQAQVDRNVRAEPRRRLAESVTDPD